MALKRFESRVALLGGKPKGRILCPTAGRQSPAGPGIQPRRFRRGHAGEGGKMCWRRRLGAGGWVRRGLRIEQMLGNQQLKRSEEAISFILCGTLEMAWNEAKSNISCIYSGIRAESAVPWRKIHSQSAIGGSALIRNRRVSFSSSGTKGGKGGGTG